MRKKVGFRIFVLFGRLQYIGKNIFSMNREYDFKFVVIGPSRTGKTNLFNQLTEQKKQQGQEIDDRLGMMYKLQDHCEKFTEKINGFKVEVCMWDTSGYWQKNKNRQQLIKNADRVLIVFDYRRRESIESIDKIELPYLQKMNKINNAVLIGNKIDDERSNKIFDATEVAQKYSIPLYFTSADHAALVKRVKEKILFGLMAEKQINKFKLLDKQKQELFIEALKVFQSAFHRQMLEKLGKIHEELGKFVPNSNEQQKKINESEDLMEKVMFLMNKVGNTFSSHHDEEKTSKVLIEELKQQLSLKQKKIQQLEGIQKQQTEELKLQLIKLKAQLQELKAENEELKVIKSQISTSSSEMRRNQQQIQNLKHDLQIKQQVIIHLQSAQEHMKAIAPSRIFMQINFDASIQILKRIQEEKKEKVKGMELIYRLDPYSTKFRSYTDKKSSLLCGLEVEGTFIWVYSTQEFLSPEAKGLLFMSRGGTTRVKLIQEHKLWKKDLAQLILGNLAIRINLDKQQVKISKGSAPFCNENIHEFLSLPEKETYILSQLQILRI